jgi:glycosyltransferase involved in cell wall biosynthesis
MGRAAPEKNRAALIPVHEELVARRDSSLWIVGPGGSEDLGPIDSDRVHLLGERDDVARLMQQADVVLLTSTREGLPGVVLEALSTDIPVVVSDLPGTRELRDSLAGIFLVPLGAPASAWADAIEAQLDHPSAPGALRQQLLDSPYGLHESAQRWEGLWSR